MKPDKSLKLAVNMVTHSRLRSWLTIIGIVIGVGSVLAIVSLGESLTAQVNSQLSSMKANLITITPGYSRASGMFGGGGGQQERFGGSSSSSSSSILTITDVRALQAIGDITVVNTQISGRANITFGSENGSVTVTGTDPKTWAQVTTSTASGGRLLSSSDSNVVVVGYSLANGYFRKKTMVIGSNLKINGKIFKVIGILNNTGRGDRSVIMPIENAFQIIDKDREEYDTLYVLTQDDADIDSVINEIDQALFSSRRVTNSTKDFTVTSTKDIQQSISSVSSSIALFLEGIAAVSLLVGAVGIANTMFTSVLEKTKEIGIMKAVGARNSDILAIFLFNSGLIGLVGGLLGVVIGTIASSFMSSLISGSGFMLPGMGRGGGVGITLVSLHVIIGVLLISVAIGVIAGAVPAYQASKLKPVDALRYE